MVSDERSTEVRELLALAVGWAYRRPDVVALGLAGSWASGDARMDSDVDLVILTREPRLYLEEDGWIHALGGLRILRTQSWGPLTERRFVLPSGLEVEAGIAPPSWASTDPVDPNLRPIVQQGFDVLYDPKGLLVSLVQACRID